MYLKSAFGTQQSGYIEGFPHVRGGLYEGLHCKSLLLEVPPKRLSLQNTYEVFDSIKHILIKFPYCLQGFGAGNFKSLFEAIEVDQEARGNLTETDSDKK